MQSMHTLLVTHFLLFSTGSLKIEPIYCTHSWIPLLGFSSEILNIYLGFTKCMLGELDTHPELFKCKFNNTQVISR